MLKTLIKACGGDMRRAITSLQSCARLKKNSEQITVDDVYEVAGIVPGGWLDSFMAACKSNSIDEIMKFIEELTLEGFSALQVKLMLKKTVYCSVVENLNLILSAFQILEQLNDFLIGTNELNDRQRSIIGEALGVKEKIYVLCIISVYYNT